MIIENIQSAFKIEEPYYGLNLVNGIYIYKRGWFGDYIVIKVIYNKDKNKIYVWSKNNNYFSKATEILKNKNLIEWL